MSNCSTPSAYLHPDPLKTLASHLLPHLPHSLALLRCLQHHPPSSTSLALATFAPSLPSFPRVSVHFAALYVDRARAPDTECWVFSTYERGRKSANGQLDMRGDKARKNMLALLAEVKRLTPDAGKPSMMVIGSMNEDLLGLLGGQEVWPMAAENVLTDARDGYTSRARSWLDRERKRLGDIGEVGLGVIAGVSPPLVKWILTSFGNPERGRSIPVLSESYHFSQVKNEELKVVLDSMDTPGSEHTVATLSNVALRHERINDGSQVKQDRRDLVAWAYVDVDGSVVNLHVHPDHKGKCLATTMLTRLSGDLREHPIGLGFSPLPEDTSHNDVPHAKGWTHINVRSDNQDIAKIAEGLGGEPGWRIRWVKVDLDRIQMAMKG